MKIRKRYIYNLVIASFVAFALSSCDDFLDKLPDNRIILDSPSKVKNLLVTSYPTANYAIIGELSADNFFDNRSPNAAGVYYNISAYDRMDNNLFAWEDVQGADREDTDTPYSVWESYYQSISAANQALKAIDEIKAAGKYSDNMDAQKGEALVLRAYSHFILVNIFGKAYKSAEASKQDLGVAYITEPSTSLDDKYERLSVAEVYDLIEKDIEEGIPLLDDDSYDVPVYHFTKSAASAFAAKFYLYKRNYKKVLDYSDMVLGTGDPSSNLRDWSVNYSNAEQQAYSYISPESSSNLLVLATNSGAFRRFMNYRYGSIGTATRGSFDDSGPTWSGRPTHLQGWIWTYKQDYGSFIPKVWEFFEYTDKNAGIGYVHVVRTEFTTDATLLDRAEAKIYLNDIDGAVADLQAWNKSHLMKTVLTKTNIKSFYTANKNYFVFDFHTQELSSDFVVTADQKPFVDCVLHFRRIDRLFEGDRWFDIKRYGIELEHFVGPTAQRQYLTYDDDRRAIQIPSNAISAGVASNPRSTFKIPDATLIPKLVY